MPIVITGLIWTLTAIVIGVLLAAVALVFNLGPEGLPYSQRVMLLPGIALGAGVLIAILTFHREAGKLERERVREQSEVLLSRATIELNRTVQLLSDRNNSRILWVRAARALERAQELGALIKDDNYALAYRLETERIRDDLYDALSLPNEDDGVRQGFPPQFYYGNSDWEGHTTLDEAAVAASRDVSAYAVSIDRNPPEASYRPLSRDSVAAIYKFLEYPDAWEDPLQSAGDWGADWEREHGIAAGAKRYADHSRGTYVIGGVIRGRGRNNDG